MPDSQSISRTVGFIAIFIAVVLYIRSVLYAFPKEPLLILASLILLAIGTYLTAERSKGLLGPARLMQVRMTGSGKPGQPQRAEWVQAQVQRANTIRQVVLTVLLAAIALFIANHVTGSIREKREDPRAFAWKNHLDRQEEVATYTTREGDTLARIAVTLGLTVSELGMANPAAELIYDPKQRPASALNPSHLLPQNQTKVILETAATDLEVPVAEIATGFATTSLQPGQPLKIPSDPPYDPLQWLDWILWALVGVAAYLLIEIARSLRRVVDGEGDFLGETTWYWTQLLVGPLIAFVILLLFTHIDIDLQTGEEAALEVNLQQYPIDLLIVPAFLLGFYSRVTREILDQIMRRIFGAAWRAASGLFEIAIKDHDGDDEVASDVIFETRPPVPVVWSVTLGTITPGGLFQKPAVTGPKQVYVTAVETGSGRAVTRTITVVQHKFQVEAPGNPSRELHPGQPQKLEVKPLPTGKEAEITWELVAPVPTGISFVEGQSGASVTIQAATEAAPGQQFLVRATYAGLSRDLPFTVVVGLGEIKAEVADQALAEGRSVTAGTEITFEVSSIDEPETITWSAEPVGLLAFTSSAGRQVTGKTQEPNAAGQDLTVRAKHPRKGESAFKLRVVPRT